jgi:sugar phosphate isomerase/epimerase
MIKPAFSTVACPEWTLDMVAANAARYGFEGVELRTFGERSTRLACDPALTAEEKALGMFHEAGIEVLSLGTSVSFEEPIKPPVIGLAIGDTERTVRAGKRAVDLAVALECPYVRVWGFDMPPREKRGSAIARITKRVQLVADHAQKTGVRLVVENGGGFSRAQELREIIDGAGSPLVGACYSLATGIAAGDVVPDAIEALAGRVWVARIKDLDEHGRVCQLGTGRLPCREFVGALAQSGFDGPLVFEWDRLWFNDLAPAEEVLPVAAKQIFHWMAELGARAAGATGGAAGGPGGAPGRAGAGGARSMTGGR